MKGSTYCQRLLARAGLEVVVVRGSMNAFVPESKIVILDRGAYNGSRLNALTVVAHEVAHAEQARHWGQWVIGLRVVTPGRLWLEWDANARARRMMMADGLAADEGVLRASWSSYVWPAWRQVLGAAVVLLGAVVWRMTG